MSINAVVGQNITLGSYPQSDVTGQTKEPIEWKVLKVEGDKALVVAAKGLDNVMFNALNTAVTWATSDLRVWLNGEFADAAFTAEEKAVIVESTINTSNSVARRVANAAPGCGETVDKVFCLSLEEVQETMPLEADRIAAPTAFAAAKGAFAHASNGACWWWLRNPGYYTSDAAGINYNGYLHVSGDNVTSPSDAVRPAMWVSIA